MRIAPLSLLPPQKIVFDKIKERLAKRQKIWMIIYKARREGMSTLIESLMTARTFMEDNVHAKVIAHIADSTSTIWNMAKLMVESHNTMSKLANISGHLIKFGNSELSVATAGSPEATRSQDITITHLSEMAFWEKPEAMLSILQCVPDNFDSWVFIESTANGKTGDGELFYKEWQRAAAGESDFIPQFVPWYVMEEYRIAGGSVNDDEEYRDEEEMLIREFNVSQEQLAWRRWAIANKCQGDVIKFHQEYPTTAEEGFVASGLPFFTTAQLAPFSKMIEHGKKFRIDGNSLVSDPSGYLEIFKRPEPGREYVIGADSSFGIEDEDHSKSTFEVLDMETLEQVAEYEASTPPHIMARHLAAAGRFYNEALLCPEVQASGGGGGRELIVYLRNDHKYYNLHQWKQGDKVGAEKAHLVGWETTSKTRPRMIARLREVIMERSCIIHSQKLLQQLSDFGENESGRLEAIQGHDDLLFAFGIALVSRSENYVAKKFKYEPEPDYDLAGMGIKTVADTSRLLFDHQQKILSGRGRTTGKGSYLEY